MSLDLPNFARRTSRGPSGAWIERLGWIALGVVLFGAAWRWMGTRDVDAVLARTRADVASLRATESEAKKSVRSSPTLLIAMVSVESAPTAILKDLSTALPPDVAVETLSVRYSEDGFARLDLKVLARSAAAYDRFLETLEASPYFDEIQPGSESRQGPLTASLTARYRRVSSAEVRSGVPGGGQK